MQSTRAIAIELKGGIVLRIHVKVGDGWSLQPREAVYNTYVSCECNMDDLCKLPSELALGEMWSRPSESPASLRH